MSTTLIGVPPGVGDVYWCLAKLKAFKKHYGLGHITLGIQRTQKDRALEWRTMVDFVDDARYVAFAPGKKALAEGFERNNGPLDFVLWPNAIVDQGKHLREWLPDLELDLDFPVKTQPIIAPNLEGRVVLYASANGVNRAWFPKRRGDFWIQLAQELEGLFGQPPLVIGADWDHDNSDSLTFVGQSIVGRTSLAEVAWILEQAHAVIGVISGMTILANHFKRPTVAFAPDKHHPDFPYTWVNDRTGYTCLRPTSMWDPTACAHHLHDMVLEACD